jgi:hypothetical protein
MTATEEILRKQLITSGLSSEEIDKVFTGLKRRAFFSARVESVRFLQKAQEQVADYLAANPRTDGALTSRASAISDIMAKAREEGIATGTGSLTDPGSVSRAKVIVDTNADLARGYVSHVSGASKGARLAFPAQELIRVEERQTTMFKRLDTQDSRMNTLFDRVSEMEKVTIGRGHFFRWADRIGVAMIGAAVAFIFTQLRGAP